MLNYHTDRRQSTYLFFVSKRHIIAYFTVALEFSWVFLDTELLTSRVNLHAKCFAILVEILLIGSTHKFLTYG